MNSFNFQFVFQIIILCEVYKCNEQYWNYLKTYLAQNEALFSSLYGKNWRENGLMKNLGQNKLNQLQGISQSNFGIQQQSQDVGQAFNSKNQFSPFQAPSNNLGYNNQQNKPIQNMQPPSNLFYMGQSNQASQIQNNNNYNQMGNSKQSIPYQNNAQKMYPPGQPNQPQKYSQAGMNQINSGFASNKNKPTTYKNPKGTIIMIDDAEVETPNEINLSNTDTESVDSNLFEDDLLGQYSQDIKPKQQNQQNQQYVPTKIEVRSSGPKPGLLGNNFSPKGPIQLWNPSVPDRYSNLTNLSPMDLTQDIESGARDDPSRYKKYSNSKGMNVLVTDQNFENFKNEKYSQDLVTVKPNVDYRAYEVDLNYKNDIG